MGFKDIFKTALPFLSAALPLPPPLGQIASRAIGSALGVDNLTPDKVDAAVANATPEQIAALKKVENDFALQMQEMGFKQVDDLLGIDAADRANARAREIATHDQTPKVLAGVVVAMTILAEGWILYHGMGMLDATSAAIVGRILGTLDSALMLVLSYYFGSSAGSTEKTRMMNNMATGGK
jgi:hypothetical protein